MKKIISCILVLSLVLAVTVSAMPSTQNSSVKMSDAQMAQTIGGDLSGWCWVAMGGVIIATVGAAAATGGWGVFIIGQLGLYSAAVGMIGSC